MTLPLIMVAPTGARRTKADHPNLPVTIPEIIESARHCHAAGAQLLHAHVRDETGKHTLDAGLYSELLAEMATQVPTMQVQITTEAVGIYSPVEQRSVVETVRPKLVSIALREMMAEEDTKTLRQFYHRQSEAGVAIQHILYAAEDLARLAREIAQGTIPGKNLSLLFVLGRYTKNQQSTPDDLLAFLTEMAQSPHTKNAEFMICAFGQAEISCLLFAAEKGGNCRIGFENNILDEDGTLARSNANRVEQLVKKIELIA